MFSVLVIDRMVRLSQVLMNGSRSYARFRLKARGSRKLPLTDDSRKVLIMHARL